MKVLSYAVDEEFYMDTLIKMNSERYNRLSFKTRAIFKNFEQIVTRTDEGKPMVIIVIDFNIPDLVPRWLLGLALKRSIRNLGYEGRIKRIDDKKTIRALMNVVLENEPK